MSRSLKFGGFLVMLATASALAGTAEPTKYVTLDQNIDQATLHRVHYTDQGSRMAPAAWLVALEKADGTGKFMSTENLARYGWLTRNVTTDTSNPYGWPIGFTVSDPQRSDGIASAGLTCAACHSGEIQFKGTVMRVEGGQGLNDLDRYLVDLAKALQATAADPARRARFLADAVAAGYPADRMERDFSAAAAGFGELTNAPPGKEGTTSGPGRGDALQGGANRLYGTLLNRPDNAHATDGPVSIPYVWDIWRLSWVQTNGLMPGEKSTSRNIGEAVSVFGKTNIIDPKTGELNPEPLRWKTSIQLDNLIWVEKAISGIGAPVWPAAIMGKVEQTKAERGKQLFTSYCAGCHGIKELPDGVWDVAVPPLDLIGTDPNMTKNWAGRTYDLSKLGLGKEATHWQGFPVVASAVLKQLYADNNTPAAEQETDFRHEAPCGYKARPLIGTWATPPFLHNGSVPTVYDLLSETRPTKFTTGSREYDPVKLGYASGPNDGSFVFDTSLSGNKNSGHWFTDETSRPGRIGSKLTESDKYAIIEFLKAATYDNYPSEKRPRMATMACQNDPEWALKK